MCRLTLQITLLLLGNMHPHIRSAPVPSSSHEHYIWPEYMTDGLMINGGAGLRGLKASWIILVTLDAPVYPPGLKDQLYKVRDSF